MIHSSISNFDADERLNRRQSIRCAMRLTVAALLLFGAVIMVYRSFVGFIEQGSNGAITGRMKNMVRYLPQIPDESAGDKSVMIFGTSMVQYGFSPNEFDRIMAENDINSTSYNYGIANLIPSFQQYITATIRKEFKQADFKLDLALIEFNPFQTTIIRKQSGAAIAEQQIAALATNEELWQRTLQNPDVGVRLFVIRYVRKGISAALFSTVMEQSSHGRPQVTPEYIALQEQLNLAQMEFATTLSKGQYPASPIIGWSPFNRGGDFDTARLSTETIEAAGRVSALERDPILMQADLEQRIATSDILQLNFDEELYAAYIKMIEDFKAVSQHVEVILLPRNTEWVNYSPEAQARLNAIKQRISEETGVYVRDFQETPEITSEHFRDTTHLDMNGIDAFTRVLAEQYAASISH